MSSSPGSSEASDARFPFRIPAVEEMAVMERVAANGETLQRGLRGWSVPVEECDPFCLFCPGGEDFAANCDNRPGLVELIRLRVIDEAYCEIVWCRDHGIAELNTVQAAE